MLGSSRWQEQPGSDHHTAEVQEHTALQTGGAGENPSLAGQQRAHTGQPWAQRTVYSQQ